MPDGSVQSSVHHHCHHHHDRSRLRLSFTLYHIRNMGEPTPMTTCGRIRSLSFLKMNSSLLSSSLSGSGHLCFPLHNQLAPLHSLSGRDLIDGISSLSLSHQRLALLFHCLTILIQRRAALSLPDSGAEQRRILKAACNASTLRITKFRRSVLFTAQLLFLRSSCKPSLLSRSLC
jgi:hypothetical protein